MDKKSPTKQKAEGLMDEAKGKAKQAWGDVTDNATTHAEGQVDEAKGKANQKIADVRKKIRAPRCLSLRAPVCFGGSGRGALTRAGRRNGDWTQGE